MDPAAAPGPAPAAPSDRAAPPEGDAAVGRRALTGFLVVAAFGALVVAFSTLSRPAISDEDARRFLEAAIVQGPRDGAWAIQEPEGERQRDFASDPAHPDRVVARLGVEPKDQVAWFPREYVAVRVFGEWPAPLFFSNYRPERPRPREDVGGSHAVRVRWVATRLAGPAPTRAMWVDPESGEVLRFEDRTFDGSLVHAARWLSPSFRGWDPAQQATPQAGGARRRRTWSFEEVVAAAPFPVYEPTRLPPGFERVGQSLRSVALPVGLLIGPRGLRVGVGHVEVVELRYSDGLARMAFALLSASDMRRIDKLAQERARRMPDEPDACPGSDASTAEELVDSADELVVRRHSNRCGTILKIEEVGGVSVVLRARNELPPGAYVEAMRSLMPAPGSKRPPEGTKSVEDWLQTPTAGGSAMSAASPSPDVPAKPEGSDED